MDYQDIGTTDTEQVSMRVLTEIACEEILRALECDYELCSFSIRAIRQLEEVFDLCTECICAGYIHEIFGKLGLELIQTHYDHYLYGIDREYEEGLRVKALALTRINNEGHFKNFVFLKAQEANL